MRLTDIDFMRLLPRYMRDDLNAQAFVYAVQRQLIKLALSIKHSQIYPRINELDDNILDELAWQFNISEYSTEYSTAIKRKLVRNCMEMHYRRGTVAAVEDVVQNIYGNSSVEEWFDYEGEPYHFKVYTSNPESSDEMLADLERIIKETQNIRSYLEAVIVEIMQTMNLYYGFKLIVMDGTELKTTDVD